MVTAREYLRVAHALSALPDTAAAFATGSLSYSKVRALTRVTTPHTEGFFLNVARHGTAGQLERVVRYARRGLALDDRDRMRAMLTKAYCDWHYDDDGMLVLRSRLMPDDGARLVAALEAVRLRELGGRLVPSLDPAHAHQVTALPISVQRAVALATVAEAAAVLESDGTGGSKVSVPQIVVHIHAQSADAGPSVDDSADMSADRDSTASDDSAAVFSNSSAHEFARYDTGRCGDDSAESSAATRKRTDGDSEDDSAEVRTGNESAGDSVAGFTPPDHATDQESISRPARIEGGVAIPVVTARRLSCDASVAALIESADGAPLSVGRRRRTVPTAIRRALQSRDAGCRFPGCCHSRFVHAHHIRHWAAGGHTALTNLVLLCSYHHQLVHEGGYTCTSAADGCLVFHTPQGRRIAPAPRSAGGCAGAVVTDNAQFGLNISADTGQPECDFHRIDYDHVMFTFFANESVRQARQRASVIAPRG